MTISNKKLGFILLLLVLAITFSLCFPTQQAYADMGPKPASYVHIDDLPNSDYLVTLMAERFSGPYDEYLAPDIPEHNYYGDLPQEKIKLAKRLNAEMLDYYYSGYADYYEGVTSIDYDWTYYSPSKFIIIVYDVENDILYTSSQINKIAFTEAYRASYNDFEKVSDNRYTFKAKSTIVNVNYRDVSEGVVVAINIGYFLLRVVATLAIELLLALCFKFTKKSYGIIAITNFATQVFLNILMWVGIIFEGALFGPFIMLIVGEFLIFIIEPIVYRKKCERENGTKKGIIFYALLANFLSLAAGFGINILEIIV